MTNRGVPVINMIGKTYGRLTVLKQYGTMVDCICECGKLKTTTSYNVRSGRTVSCGCYRQQVTASNSMSHNMTGSPTYMSWAGMKNRCNNNVGRHNSHVYENISYDPRWEKFEAFLSDMGERPEGTTLDRKEGKQGYCKDNCRWATNKEQWLNRDDPRVQVHLEKQKAIEEIEQLLGQL